MFKSNTWNHLTVCKQMNLAHYQQTILFTNHVTYKGRYAIKPNQHSSCLRASVILMPSCVTNEKRSVVRNLTEVAKDSWTWYLIIFSPSVTRRVTNHNLNFRAKQTPFQHCRRMDFSLITLKISLYIFLFLRPE